MDSIFKFMSTRSCLDRIDELQRAAKNQHHWEQMVKLEYAGQAIIANWGNRRTYIVTDIEFNSNPLKQTFEFHGQQVSVADYFQSCYKMQVTKLKQPLFLIRNGDVD